MNKKEFLITAIVVVLAIALVATIVILKRTDDTPDTSNTGVAHDHNGDGIPDHGDDAHGDATEGTAGGNVDAVIPDDSDVDISIDLEDIPADSTKPTTGNNGPTTGNNGPTTGNNEPTTGNNEPTTGATEPTTGNNEPTTGATEPTTGATDPTNPSSGAVSGNEIDFDDLLNAGRN